MGEHETMRERMTDEEWVEMHRYLSGSRSDTVLRLMSEAERARANETALLARLEEPEHAMHMRIRADYGATVADCWRAKVAEVEAERDALARRAEALGGVAREWLAMHDEPADWPGRIDRLKAAVRATRAALRADSPPLALREPEPAGEAKEGPCPGCGHSRHRELCGWADCWCVVRSEP